MKVLEVEPQCEVRAGHARCGSMLGHELALRVNGMMVGQLLIRVRRFVRVNTAANLANRTEILGTHLADTILVRIETHRFARAV
jgi:hypothetical protein